MKVNPGLIGIGITIVVLQLLKEKREEEQRKRDLEISKMTEKMAKDLVNDAFKVEGIF